MNSLRNNSESLYINELFFNNSVFTICNRYKPSLEDEKLKIIEHVLMFGKIYGREIKYMVGEHSNCYTIINEMLEEGLIKVL